MSELRLEAISLIDEISDENIEKVVNFLKNLVKEEDPFWSKENQKYLRKSIRELDEGKGQEHDLIDS